jgi:hypothetical protein
MQPSYGVVEGIFIIIIIFDPQRLLFTLFFPFYLLYKEDYQ